LQEIRELKIGMIGKIADCFGAPVKVTECKNSTLSYGQQDQILGLTI